MKEIILKHGSIALVDDADFASVAAHSWCERKDKCGIVYAATGHETTRMHRFILGIDDPKIEIDHLNHNGLDNQRHNLRTCNRQQNQRNQRVRKGSSQYKGVHRQGKLWIARIGVNYTRRYLGCFSEEETAARAYDAAARELFGDFVQCNFSSVGK